MSFHVAHVLGTCGRRIIYDHTPTSASPIIAGTRCTRCCCSPIVTWLLQKAHVHTVHTLGRWIRWRVGLCAVTHEEVCLLIEQRSGDSILREERRNWATEDDAGRRRKGKHAVCFHYEDLISEFAWELPCECKHTCVYRASQSRAVGSV